MAPPDTPRPRFSLARGADSPDSDRTQVSSDSEATVIEDTGSDAADACVQTAPRGPSPLVEEEASSRLPPSPGLAE